MNDHKFKVHVLGYEHCSKRKKNGSGLNFFKIRSPQNKSYRPDSIDIPMLFIEGNSERDDGDSSENLGHGHYVFITSLSRLLKGSQTYSNKKHHICIKCLAHFRTEKCFNNSTNFIKIIIIIITIIIQ